jgi:hypothetical protein
MHAQVFEYDGGEEPSNAAASSELISALRTEDGFSGAVTLIERRTGAMLLLVFWETEEEAISAPSPALAALLGRVQPRIWEVDARA